MAALEIGLQAAGRFAKQGCLLSIYSKACLGSAPCCSTVRPAHTNIDRAVAAALRDVADAVLARDERCVRQLGVVRAASVRGASSAGRGRRGRAATLPRAPAAMCQMCQAHIHFAKELSMNGGRLALQKARHFRSLLESVTLRLPKYNSATMCEPMAHA
jgi:hypothetical protein